MLKSVKKKKKELYFKNQYLSIVLAITEDSQHECWKNGDSIVMKKAYPSSTIQYLLWPKVRFVQLHQMLDFSRSLKWRNTMVTIPVVLWISLNNRFIFQL